MTSVSSKKVSKKRPVISKQAISLFSGAGGDSFGLKCAGYNVCAFSEFKKPAIATHLKEFPYCPLIQSESTDICTIPDEMFEIYKHIDLIFAGFPCQGFSNAGKKKVNDPRNELVNEFARVTRIIKPTYIIGENVSGLLSRNGKDPVSGIIRPVIDIISDLFNSIGYNITYKVLKATDFGVPQERKRLIIIGCKSELGYPHMSWDFTSPPCSIRHILETHLNGAVEIPSKDVSPHYWIKTDLEEVSGKPHPNLLRLVNGIRNKSTKEKEEGDADGDAGEDGIGDGDVDGDGDADVDVDRDADAEVKEEKELKEDEKEKDEKEKGKKKVKKEKKKKEKEVKEKKVKDLEKDLITVKGGLISFGVRKSSYHGQVLDPDMPCKTIICTYASCPRLFVGLYNPTINKYWVRCLSIKELGQIQGFPADYQWQGNEKEIITQIGNAVPPALCEGVVRKLSTIVFKNEP